MRILIYNFVQPGDPAHKQGGGVAVYQSNLIRALQADGQDVISLSSGDRYTLFGTEPHLTSFRKDGLERAIIVNSPVFAPAHAAFHRIDLYAQHSGLNGIPGQLKARYGEIDVFHFQNVEGLTAGFFRHLRTAFPKARILVSAHNYNLVCPQVNLWFREHEVCTDYRDGRACVNCLLSPNLHRFQRNMRRMERILETLGINRRSPLLRPVKWLIRAPFRLRRGLAAWRGAPQDAAGPIVLTSERKARDFAEYRRTNIELCGSVFDRVLAVSERTRTVLVERGVPADRVAVSRIGTAHAAHFRGAKRVVAAGDPLHIAYLGYMRADKGFYFLLRSLEALPESLARRLCVTIAAPITDHHAVERLRAMAHRFREIILHDGFTHATLDRVLEGVHLGIVPVLWEDNLPQVAIEMVSRGVPILTSDRGGAQEIAQNGAFTFAAGSHAGFAEALRRILGGKLPLARFWEGELRLLSMEEHREALMRHYRAGAERPAAPEDAVPGAPPVPLGRSADAAEAVRV